MATQKQEQFKFSLSKQDKHSREVKKIISFLRGKGILSQAIRDGLRLINDLRRGNIKVLVEMFPEVIEKLCPPDPSKDDIGELKRMIADLQRKVDQQQMIYVPADSTIPDNRPGGYISVPGEKLPRSLGSGFVPQLPPADDDDDFAGLIAVVDTQPEPGPQRSFIDVMLNGDWEAVFAAGKNHTAEENALTLKNLRKQ